MATKKKTSKKATKNATKKAVKKAAKRITIKKVAKKVIKKPKTTKKRVAKKAKVPVKKVAKSGGHKVPEMAVVSKVNIGAHVPNFEIPATGGKKISLESLKGKNVVLYFYPKDATPGCTIEGHEFTKLYPEFERENTEVFGISRDDLKSHEKFKEKEGYCFDLLSDETGELSETFGVWKQKNMYGRTYMGIERSTFFIDSNGILKKEWRGVKVNGHAEEVLRTIKAK